MKKQILIDSYLEDRIEENDIELIYPETGKRVLTQKRFLKLVSKRKEEEKMKDEIKKGGLMSGGEMRRRYDESPTLLNALELSVENWERKIENWTEAKKVNDACDWGLCCALCYRRRNKGMRCCDCPLFDYCRDGSEGRGEEMLFYKVMDNRDNLYGLKYAIEMVEILRKLRDKEKESEKNKKKEIAEGDKCTAGDLKVKDIFELLEDVGMGGSKNGVGEVSEIDRGGDGEYISAHPIWNWHADGAYNFHFRYEYEEGNYGIRKTVKVRLIKRYTGKEKE